MEEYKVFSGQVRDTPDRKAASPVSNSHYNSRGLSCCSCFDLCLLGESNQPNFAPRTLSFMFILATIVLSLTFCSLLDGSRSRGRRRLS